MDFVRVFVFHITSPEVHYKIYFQRKPVENMVVSGHRNNLYAGESGALKKLISLKIHEQPPVCLIEF